MKIINRLIRLFFTKGSKPIRTLLFLTVLFPLTIYLPGKAQTSAANLILDPSQIGQTITGWTAVAQIGQNECTGYERYKDEVIERGVDELGISRLQLAIPSGMENPVDYFGQYLAGQIPFSTYQQNRYEFINDNNDPFTIDPAGIQFTYIDHTIDNLVLPMKTLLEAKGEQLNLILTYVDFNKSNVDHGSNAEEYAEYFLAIFDHFQTKYGWVPDAIEVILEPDVAAWNPALVANALVAAGKRLEGNGYSVDFLAPSTTNMGAAVSWFDRMIQNPEVLNYLTDITYHRYSGVSEENLQAIAARANQYKLNTGMLEHIGSDQEDLHADLKMGMNSSWSQYALAYCYKEDSGAQHYWITDLNSANPIVNFGMRSKFLQQYFLFIRPGATRIGITTDNPSFDPLAFINTNGGFVVVTKAGQPGSISVQGLPAGVYEVTYTTKNEYSTSLPDALVQEGSAVIASIPAPGVITVAWKSELPAPTEILASPSPNPTPTLQTTNTDTPTIIPAIIPTEQSLAVETQPPLNLQPTPQLVQPGPGCTGRFAKP